MRIGIDIDGVLTNLEECVLAYASKYCYEHKLNISINPKLMEEEAFGFTANQTTEFWNEYLLTYVVNTKARQFAPEIIKKLKEEGNEIYIITARNEYGLPEHAGKMQDLTKKWLKENDIIYDQIIFSKNSKLQNIEENKIDIMIEDNPNNVLELSSIIPMLCYHSEYNAEVTGDKITRVYSGYDIYEKIESMKTKRRSI